MFRIFFALLVFDLLLVNNLFAYFDSKCMSKCTSAGYVYDFCTKKCSYEIDNNYHKIGGKCCDKCCADGFDYMFCQNKCSY